MFFDQLCFDPSPLLLTVGLQDVQTWVAAGGYFVLFALLFACGLGLPLPEDIPLLVAGALVQAEKMDLLAVSIVAWCGIIGGDCVLYCLGRRYGHHITRLPLIGRHITEPRMQRVERLFERWGVWVVGVGRMFAGIRGAMVVVAGATRYSFLKFVLADGLAAIVSGGLFVALGYILYDKLGQTLHNLHTVEHWLLIGAVAVAACIGTWLYLSRRRAAFVEPPSR